METITEMATGTATSSPLGPVPPHGPHRSNTLKEEAMTGIHSPTLRRLELDYPNRNAFGQRWFSTDMEPVRCDWCDRNAIVEVSWYHPYHGSGGWFTPMCTQHVPNVQILRMATHLTWFDRKAAEEWNANATKCMIELVEQ